MKWLSVKTDVRQRRTLQLWLNRPLTSFQCFMGWLGSSILFFAVAGALGGPSYGDVSESSYGTWSIAHGNLACAYPVLNVVRKAQEFKPFASIAPLYPLLSGWAEAVLRIGRSVPFPSSQILGANCANAIVAIHKWSNRSHAILPTIRLGYLTWPVVAVAVVALVRVSGRGKSGWEPIALVLVACSAPVVMSITYFFHPEDLLALGLVLASVATLLKKKWFWTGVLLGLAYSSQQFALLVIASFVVIVPWSSKWKFIVGGVASAALIDAPLLIASSGRALRPILLGSSRVGQNVRSTGGTVLWETELRGPFLFLISRVLPVLAVIALSWWASRRLGPKLLEPVAVIALVASAFTIRLVFEENLFGYYFLAVAVALIVLDVARGHIRGPVLAWLALVTMAFNPIHTTLTPNTYAWSFQLHDLIPEVLFLVGVVSVLYDGLHHRFKPYKVAWIVLVALTCETKIWGLAYSAIAVPNWLWQLILVPIALILSLRPLLDAEGFVNVALVTRVEGS